MVDLMSVEGGPGRGASPMKVILIFLGVIFVVLMAAGIATAMTLPKTISCFDQDTGFYVQKVDLPTVSAISPSLVCLAVAQTLSFSGTGFINYNGFTPNVSIGSVKTISSSTGQDGVVLDVWRQDITLHPSLSASFAPSNAFSEISRPTVVVAQPVPDVAAAHFTSAVDMYAADGCLAESRGLVVIPPPLIERMQPRVAYLGTNQTFFFEGKHFVFVKSARKRQDVDTPAPSTSAPASGMPFIPTGMGGSPNITVKQQVAGGVRGTACATSSIEETLQDCTAIAFNIAIDSLEAEEDEVVPITVYHPDPIGCSAPSENILVINPMTIAEIIPDLLIPELAPAKGKLVGTGFVRMGTRLPRVYFRLRQLGSPIRGPDSDEALFEARDVVLSDCFDPSGGLVDDIEVCKTLDYTIPVRSGENVNLELVLVPPAPMDVSGGVTTKVLVLPAPKFEPQNNVICANGAVVVFDGVFYEINGRSPNIQIGTVVSEGLQLGGRMPMQLDTGPKVVTIFTTLTLTAGENILPPPTTAKGRLAVTPKVSITYEDFEVPGAVPIEGITFIPATSVDVRPFPGVCTGMGVQRMQFEGNWIVQLEDRLPNVYLTTGMQAPVKLEGVQVSRCSTFDIVKKYTSAANCRVVSFPVPVDSSGVLSFENPDPIGCGTTLTTPLAAVPRPVLTSITQDDVCVGQDGAVLTFQGTFPVVGTRLPLVTLNGVAFDNTTCEAMTGSVCSSMKLFMDGLRAATFSSNISYSDIDVVVRANNGCAAQRVITIQGLPTGVLTKATPSRVCSTSRTPLVLEGLALQEGGNLLYGSSSAMSLAETPLIPGSLGGCVLENGASLCTSANATLPNVSSLTDATGEDTKIDLGVKIGAACTSRLPAAITVIPVPVITNVTTILLKNANTIPGAAFATETGQMCHDQGATIEVTGSKFAVVAKATQLVLRPASGEDVVFRFGNPKLTVTSTKITLKTDANELPPGVYTIVVRNGDGCDAVSTGKFKLNVNPVVVIHAASPAVLPPRSQADLRLMTTGLLRPTDVRAVGVTLSAVDQDPNVRLLPALAIDLITKDGPASGDFPIVIESDIGCRSAPASVIKVDVERMSQATPEPKVIIGTRELVVTAAAGTTFNPGTILMVQDGLDLEVVRESHVINGGTAVRGLFDVSLQTDGTEEVTLFAVDNVAKTASKVSGLRYFANRKGLTPLIRVVAPSALIKSEARAYQVQVDGDNEKLINCRLVCRDSPSIVECSSINALDVRTETSDFEIQLLPAFFGTLQVGDVCRFEFTSFTTEGFSLVAPWMPVYNNVASERLGASTNVARLATARFGACAVVTEVPVRRGALPSTFVHVIGGSAGNGAGAALSSIETALFDLSKAQTPTFAANSPLISGVSGASCVATGTHVVVAGGQATAFAAQADVLYPDDTAELTVQITLRGSDTLPPGTHTYAVSRVRGAAGEDLPSNLATVLVPPNTRGVAKLTWTLSPDVPSTPATTAWNIYRATGMNALQLVSVVVNPAARSYSDQGAPVMMAKAPRVAGSLSEFSSVDGGLAGSQGVSYQFGGEHFLCAGTKCVKPSGGLLVPGPNLPVGLLGASVLHTRSLIQESNVDVKETVALVSGTTALLLNSETGTFTQGSLSGSAPQSGCGAAGTGVAFVVGGDISTARLHHATFTSNSNVAVVNRFDASQNGDLRAVQSAACARVPGALIVAGGRATVGGNAVRDVTVVVV